VRVRVADLPVGAAVGKVFFARVNLKAVAATEVNLCRIEPEWGTVGPLHFEESDS
jgi:hypothetical protein